MASPTDSSSDIKGVAVSRLNSTKAALRDALERQDWPAIGKLDLQCRTAVEDALLESGYDEAALRESLDSLLGLYRQLISVCQDERQRLAGELCQVNRAHKGAKVYQLFN